ncbi:hypothetical protein SAB1890 [Staphylococcus aureus RF122]|nr:hypothetical protein SAB1890 [Staphylococcus aureus RF122]
MLRINHLNRERKGKCNSNLIISQIIYNSITKYESLNIY